MVTSQLAAQGGSSPPSRCSTIDRSQAGGAAAAAATGAATAQKLEKQQFTPKIRPPHGDCKQDIDLSAPGGSRGGGGEGGVYRSSQERWDASIQCSQQEVPGGLRAPTVRELITATLLRSAKCKDHLESELFFLFLTKD